MARWRNGESWRLPEREVVAPKPAEEGRGEGKSPNAIPEMVAKKWAKGMRARVHRGMDVAARQVDDLMDGVELRTKVKARYFEIAMMHLAGYTNAQIKASFGYKDKKAIGLILKKPEVASLVEKVRVAQVQALVKGEYGVRAAAQAAAPQVMEQVIRRAGGVVDPETKTPRGVAARDSDQLRAAKMVLDVSGHSDVTHRHTHLHGHALLDRMTHAELAQFAETGQLPERLGGAIDVTPGPEKE